MAKIDMNAFRKSAAAANGARVTIGNNRQVQHTPDGEVVFRLHGHPIVRIADRAVTLDTHGYATSTTRSAMQDFVEAATGAPFAASFAKGGFAVRYAGRDYQSDSNTLSFPV